MRVSSVRTPTFAWLCPQRRFCRHPSYFGWTMWAVGTQVLLSNYLCIVSAFVVWLQLHGPALCDRRFTTSPTSFPRACLCLFACACVHVSVLCLQPAFAAAAYLFFRDRIAFEEAYLIRFFGREYVVYRDTTWSGIPFVQ